MTAAMEQHVLDLMQCWHTHDLDGLVSRIAEDAVYTPDLVSQPIRGREAIRKEWAGYIQRMPTYDMEVRNILSSDRVVFLERWERFRLPEDKPMVLNIITLVGVYEFNADGLIAVWRDYYDTSVYKAPTPTGGAQ